MGAQRAQVRLHVLGAGPSTEAELLAWAPSCPPATMRVYLRKLVEAGRLATRDLEPDGTKLYWAPPDALGPAPVAQSQADPRAVEEQIAALEAEHVELRYDTNVKGHMERLHRYNEVRDTTQDILGRIASAEGTTVAALYERYGLELGN